MGRGQEVVVFDEKPKSISYIISIVVLHPFYVFNNR